SGLRSAGSLLRWFWAYSSSRQLCSGSDWPGRPFTIGAANCMAVWARMRTTKLRITWVWVFSASLLAALGAGKPFHIACSLATGPTALALSFRMAHTIGRYFALSLASAAVEASVAV